MNIGPINKHRRLLTCNRFRVSISLNCSMFSCTTTHETCSQHIHIATWDRRCYCMGTTNTFARTKQSGAYKFIATMYIYHELSRSVSVTFWSPSMPDHDVLLLHIFHRIFSIAFFEWMSRYLAKSVFLGHFLAMNEPNHMKELKFLLKNILCGKLTNTYLSLTEIGHCLQQMNFSSLQLHWNTSTFARIPHKKSVTWNCIY